MITLKISGKKTPIPTEWDDVTYRQYIAFLDTNNSLPEYIALFTGIPLETLLKAELKNLETISIALSFLTVPPKMEAKPTSMVGPYTLPKDVTLSSLGQFEDLRSLLKKLPKSLETKEEQKQVAELYLKACAIYAQKIIHGEYDPERVPKVKEELKNYSCIEVLQTGGFFLSKPLNISQNTKTRSQNIRQRLRKLIQDFPGYQKTLDLLQPSTRSQKE